MLDKLYIDSTIGGIGTVYYNSWYKTDSQEEPAARLWWQPLHLEYGDWYRTQEAWLVACYP